MVQNTSVFQGSVTSSPYHPPPPPRGGEHTLRRTTTTTTPPPHTHTPQEIKDILREWISHRNVIM